MSIALHKVKLIVFEQAHLDTDWFYTVSFVKNLNIPLPRFLLSTRIRANRNRG